MARVAKTQNEGSRDRLEGEGNQAEFESRYDLGLKRVSWREGEGLTGQRLDQQARSGERD